MTTAALKNEFHLAKASKKLMKLAAEKSKILYAKLSNDGRYGGHDYGDSKKDSKNSVLDDFLQFIFAFQATPPAPVMRQDFNSEALKPALNRISDMVQAAFSPRSAMQLCPA